MRQACSYTNEAELVGNKIVLLPLAPCGRGSSRLRMLMSITDTGEGMNSLGIIVTQNQKQKTSGGHSLS